MTFVNVCRNCKYFKPDKSFHSADQRLSYGTCLHPKSQTINIITGKVDYKLARYFREDSTIAKREIDVCGSVGKFYEDEPNTFIKLQREFYMPFYWSFIIMIFVFLILSVRVSHLK